MDDDNLISTSDADAMLAGTGSDAATVAATGGVGNSYVANQDPWTAADEGTVVATPNASGGSNVSTASPSWLSAFTSALTPVASTVTTVAPLINNTPATAAAGKGVTTPTGSVTAKLTSALSSSTVLILAAVAVVLYFVLGKKKSRA